MILLFLNICYTILANAAQLGFNSLNRFELFVSYFGSNVLIVYGIAFCVLQACISMALNSHLNTMKDRIKRADLNAENLKQIRFDLVELRNLIGNVDGTFGFVSLANFFTSLLTVMVEIFFIFSPKFAKNKFYSYAPVQSIISLMKLSLMFIVAAL